MTKRGWIAAGAVAALSGTAVAGVRRAMRPLPAQALPGQLREIDGEWIHYLDEGEGDAVVFVHGFAGSSFTWRYAVASLSSAHRAVAIDLPGFGFSDRSPLLDYSHEAHARRVVRLMDTLGIERATIVGHSMGGAVAQRVALAYPARVERLVLLAAVDASEAAPWHDRRRLNPSLIGLVDLALRFPPLVGFASRRIVRGIVSDPAYGTPEVIDGYVRPVLVPGTARAVARMVEATLREPVADLSRIAVPTLVLSGQHDRAVPLAVGEGIARRIPGARHVVIPQTGHLSAEERPEVFVEELLAFMHSAAVGGDLQAPAAG